MIRAIVYIVLMIIALFSFLWLGSGFRIDAINNETGERMVIIKECWEWRIRVEKEDE